jgi:hypothetical protein
MMPPYTVATIVRAVQTEMDIRDAKRERQARHVLDASGTNVAESDSPEPSRQPRFRLIPRLVRFDRPALEAAGSCQCFVDRG